MVSYPPPRSAPARPPPTPAAAPPAPRRPALKLYQPCSGSGPGTPGRPGDTSAARPASGQAAPATRSGHADHPPACPRARKLDAVAVLTARLLPAPPTAAAPGPALVPRSARQNGAMTAGRPVKKKRPAGWSPFAGIARIRSLGVAVQPLSCPRPLSLSSRPRVSPGTPFGPAPSITSQTIFTVHGADDRRLGPKARPARAKRRVSPRPAASRDGGRRSCFQIWPQGHSLAVTAGGPVENRPLPLHSRAARHRSASGR
jgi:hypothetical protein